MKNEFTLEELKRKMRENQEFIQNVYIDELLDRVQNLCNKANKRDYVQTEHERIVFEQIKQVIDYMSKWF